MIVKHDVFTLLVGITTGGLTAISVDEMMSIAFYAVGIVSLLVGTFISIATWKKKAMEDGKIGEEELHELGEIVEDASNKINQIKPKEVIDNEKTTTK